MIYYILIGIGVAGACLEYLNTDDTYKEYETPRWLLALITFLIWPTVVAFLAARKLD